MMESGVLRHDWYQTDEVIVLSILYKKAVKENVSVDFSDFEVTCSIKIDDSREQQTTIQLAKAIDIQKSAFQVLGTKIEITLFKHTVGRWNDLEPTNEELKVQGYPSSAKKVMLY
jgi:suppressor of G2 allele of SKP1